MSAAAASGDVEIPAFSFLARRPPRSGVWPCHRRATNPGVAPGTCSTRSCRRTSRRFLRRPPLCERAPVVGGSDAPDLRVRRPGLSALRGAPARDRLDRPHPSHPEVPAPSRATLRDPRTVARSCPATLAGGLRGVRSRLLRTASPSRCAGGALAPHLSAQARPVRGRPQW